MVAKAIQMKLIRRSLPDLLFGVLWSAVTLGLFELFVDLSRLDPSKHPLWSSIFGPPWLHHLYYFQLTIALLWLYIRRPYLFTRLSKTLNSFMEKL